MLWRSSVADANISCRVRGAACTMARTASTLSSLSSRSASSMTMVANMLRLELALGEQLRDPARRTDHQVRLLFQLVDLPLGGGAADQQQRTNRPAGIGRQVAALTMDLQRQLVGRRDDHRLSGDLAVSRREKIGSR